MMELLLSASMDAALEATRVFGNLSQSKDVRSVIMQHKGETDARCFSGGATCCGPVCCLGRTYLQGCSQWKHGRSLWPYRPAYLGSALPSSSPSCYHPPLFSPPAHRFVVTLLDSESTEMCYSACGVLTNLSLDSLARVRLSQEGAVAK